MVDLGAAVAPDQDQSVQPLALGIQWAGQVGRDLAALVGAQLQLDLALGFGLRALGAEVEHPADLALAIEHRAGAAQQLHALQGVGVGAGGVVGAVAAQQAVQVLGHIAATGLEAVDAAVEIARHDARAVGRGLAQGGGTLGLDLVARDHRDGLGRLQHRGVGLGGAGALPGHETRHRRGGAFCLGAGLDGDGRQRFFGGGLDGPRALGLQQAGQGQGAQRERGLGHGAQAGLRGRERVGAPA